MRREKKCECVIILFLITARENGERERRGREGGIEGGEAREREKETGMWRDRERLKPARHYVTR